MGFLRGVGNFFVNVGKRIGTWFADMSADTTQEGTKTEDLDNWVKILKGRFQNAIGAFVNKLVQQIESGKGDQTLKDIKNGIAKTEKTSAILNRGTNAISKKKISLKREQSNKQAIAHSAEKSVDAQKTINIIR